ncbi:uncharacterized protein LOC121730900 [Aricia agestis]|uniref:uncharacterized protein LOC121730900 n=1 Tax=Aricia agestis TaxID=91739 RepID=UPI001C208F78|nr:uncharacterized protein LOC121730900 [Aricia agestis]
MEALERRRVLAAIVLVIFWSQCAQGRQNSTRMSYVCPPQFVRLGHSCYYFSDTTATWQSALFACKDLNSSLSVPARWEDRNLRNHLNDNNAPKASRWIGGIYDYASKAWKWGGELRRMHYQSFSKMQKLSPEQLQFHCIAMVPELLYRWAPRNCFEKRQYICQTKLKKVPKSKLKEIRRRYQRMGKLNEITAPSLSREEDPRINDVTSDPESLRPKAYDLRPQDRPKPNFRNKQYDLRPNELRKRSRPHAERRLTRPFPGYRWNRHDPEGSYRYNEAILKSGRTGLTPQKVKGLLSRLRHMRDRQIANRRRQKERDDWLENEPRAPPMVQTHVRTYTLENNISALHPKTIVEEFDMMPAPVVLPRPTRGIW